MYEINGKVFRNIQEQVEKNKQDIAAMKNIDNILNEFGIKVLGRVDTELDIPEGTYEYGDAYLVGTETPYDMYIWTRADGSEGVWENIGPVSVVGPQGPQGIQGPKGDTGATGQTGATGPQGIQGEKGDKGDTGATGPQGIQGIQGPQGDPGQSFMIMGTINDTSLLPDPSTTPRNYAYVYKDGDPTTPDRLYYITGDAGSEVWSYSSFAQVGTTVTVNGSGVSTFNADTKLDKDTISGANARVYGVDELGGQVRYSLNGGIGQPTPGHIARYDSNGRLRVNDEPSISGEATSKGYVDSRTNSYYSTNQHNNTYVNSITIGDVLICYGRAGGYRDGETSGSTRTYHINFPDNYNSTDYMVIGNVNSDTNDLTNYTPGSYLGTNNRTVSGCDLLIKFNSSYSRGVDFIIIGKIATS